MADEKAGSDRLSRQIEFIVEMDKLKKVLRRNLLMDGSRNENDVEHSWHLAIMAMLLAEHADVENLDLTRVMKMVLIHDMVEIDAGDTFAYDAGTLKDQLQRERKAADRIFGMLPADQGAEMKALWDEFDEGRTVEARFAAAMDRLEPFLDNYHTNGGTWKIHGITRAQVLKRAEPIAQISQTLWAYVQEMIDDSVRRGFILE